MIVLHLTNCPPALRGDLTKWLMEIAAGVYVGRVSARVREKLWARTVETCKGGRAVLVFSTNNEQRMDFRIHGETWEPIDFDGLKLMMRPSPSRLVAKQAKRGSGKKLGFSNASKHRVAKNKKKNEQKSVTHTTYVVIDVETTGLDPDVAEITEVGALKVVGGVVVDSFQSLVKIEGTIPPEIEELTGITSKMLAQEGKELFEVLKALSAFVAHMPLVAHNAAFDLSFLNTGFTKCGMAPFNSKVIDTLELARRNLKGLDSYKLKSLAAYFDVVQNNLEHGKGLQLHRSLGDCYLTHMIYEKLLKLRSDGA